MVEHSNLEWINKLTKVVNFIQIQWFQFQLDFFYDKTDWFCLLPVPGVQILSRK